MADTWAFGTEIRLGSLAGTVWTYTEIARVEDISGGGITQAFDEVTAHDSVGRYRQYLATLLELGEISFDIIWDPQNATHNGTTGLLNEIQDGTTQNYQVRFPTATPVTWTFSAFVTSFSWNAPVDGALRASIGLRPTGNPTFS